MAEWIDVRERCPTPRTKVLVAYKRGVTIAEYRGFDTELVNGVLQKEYYWHGIKGAKDSFRSVTHWMPLPNPPWHYGKQNRTTNSMMRKG